MMAQQTTTTSQHSARTHAAFCGAMRLRRPLLPGVLVALLAVMVCALTGCAFSAPGASGTGAPSAKATMALTATGTPPPLVTMTVMVEQQGTVAMRNVHLLVSINVTNHTTGPISITGPYCNSPNPPVLIDVANAEGKTIWQTHLWDGPCPHVQPIDVAHLAPNAIEQWVITNDLSHESVQYGNPPPGPPPLVANTSYTVRATLLLWHQGSVQDIGNPNVLQGQDVVGEASVVLR